MAHSYGKSFEAILRLHPDCMGTDWRWMIGPFSGEDKHEIQYLTPDLKEMLTERRVHVFPLYDGTIDGASAILAQKSICNKLRADCSLPWDYPTFRHSIDDVQWPLCGHCLEFAGDETARLHAEALLD